MIKTKDYKYLIIAGAAKSGTTSLHYMFSQHPEVEATLKEYPIFSYPELIPNNENIYQVLRKKSKKKILFSDVNLMYSVNGIKRLKKIVSDKAKIIVLIRKPSERIKSHYKFNLSKGIEQRTFEEVISDNYTFFNKKETSFKYEVDYYGHTNYPKNIKKILNYFDRSQIEILIFEEFFDKNLLSNYKGLLKRLNLSKDININKTKHLNKTYTTKNYFNILDQFVLNPEKLIFFKKFLKKLLSFRARQVIKGFHESLTPKKKINIENITFSKNFQSYEKKIIFETQKIIRKNLDIWSQN